MGRNRKPDLISRREDYFVLATVVEDGTEIQNVPCKVYLPERTHEKPYLLFNPTRQDAARMYSSHQGAFSATMTGLDEKPQNTLFAPVVYLSENSTITWGGDLSVSTVVGEPQDLHDIAHLTADGPPVGSSIDFWISPNSFLSPCISSKSSYTGEITYKRVTESNFVIKGDKVLEFDKRFKSKNLDSGDVVQWSYLIATMKTDTPAIDLVGIKDSLLEDIDDFLLLVSFGCRRRTACLGWSAHDNSALTTFYRGNYAFPDIRNKVDINDVVVDIEHFKGFIERSYRTFLEYENKLALRTALHSTIPSNPHLLESSYLSMFAGLETIILDFRRRENLEVVLPKDEWGALKKYLKDCIKKFEPAIEKEKRGMIYNKLEELNRVSLREAFEVFCKNYNIDLSDLWQVFEGKGGVGLVHIRNKLIHGDPFPHDLFGALIVAKEHLKYTLERVMTRVLGWDVERTKVSPAVLEVYGLGMKDLQAEQEKLAAYIFSE